MHMLSVEGPGFTGLSRAGSVGQLARDDRVADCRPAAQTWQADPHPPSSPSLPSARYWCIVYMYAKSQAKCAFKWKPSDLQPGYESGVLSPFTLVAGINEDKDKSFPWIKASYFIPLAAVLKGESLWGKPYVAMTRYQLTFLTEYGIKGVLSGLMSSCTSISGTLTSNPSAHFADQYASNTSSAHFSDQYASNNPSAQLSDQYASNSSNTQMGTKEALASELIIVGSSTRGSGDTG
eukprot:gene4310-14420_t